MSQNIIGLDGQPAIPNQLEMHRLELAFPGQTVIPLDQKKAMAILGYGLTKLEYAAIHIFAGSMANSSSLDSLSFSDAVNMAELLLLECKKRPPQPMALPLSAAEAAKRNGGQS